MFLSKTLILKEILCGHVDSAKNKTGINQFTLSHQTLNIVSLKIVTYQTNLVPTKIIPPIILFLIDISGSMTSSIYTDLWTKSEQAQGKSTSLITTQIKKIIEDSVMRKN
jgi:hypothetical protein